MQKELLELELKYGPLEVSLPKDDDPISSPATASKKKESQPTEQVDSEQQLYSAASSQGVDEA